MKEKKGLTGFDLKRIAVVSMCFSHIYVALLRNVQDYNFIFLNVIGRLAFPIYCFLLVEGFFYTKDRKRYVCRLLAFALISEIPFDMMVAGKILYLYKQNVFLTLFIGFLVIWAMEREVKQGMKLIYVLIGMWVASILHTDYAEFGIWMIVCFYLFRDYKKGNLLSNVGNQVVLGGLQYGMIQTYAAFSAIPIFYYNGEKGKSYKMLFYAIYPAHLLLLGMIRMIFL